MDCPNEHGRMILTTAPRMVTFRKRRIEYPAKHYVCPECGISVDDIALAAENQRNISDAFRKASGLLTGDEIVAGRKGLKWTQEKLAKAMNVGVASVKRWETGQIQTKVMDKMLRRVLAGDPPLSNAVNGNRTLSLPRIKAVLKQFSEELGRDMLKDDPNDNLLYEAKYLWYADMVAFRETGQGLTGATYARLPQGPQLNNYKDLIPMIRESDENEAEPLSDTEIRIIARIAATFPTNQSIYRVSHDEPAYTGKRDGELIPYTDAESIKAL